MLAYHSGSHFSPKDTTKLRQMLEFSEPNMEQLLVGWLLACIFINSFFIFFIFLERACACVCVCEFRFSGKANAHNCRDRAIKM